MIASPRRIVRTFPSRSPQAPAGRSMKTRAAGSAPTRAPARNADAPKYRPYCGTAGLMIEIPIITRNTGPERTAAVGGAGGAELQGPRIDAVEAVVEGENRVHVQVAGDDHRRPVGHAQLPVSVTTELPPRLLKLIGGHVVHREEHGSAVREMHEFADSHRGGMTMGPSQRCGDRLCEDEIRGVRDAVFTAYDLLEKINGPRVVGVSGALHCAKEGRVGEDAHRFSFPPYTRRSMSRQEESPQSSAELTICRNSRSPSGTGYRAPWARAIRSPGASEAASRMSSGICSFVNRCPRRVSFAWSLSSGSFPARVSLTVVGATEWRSI